MSEDEEKSIVQKVLENVTADTQWVTNTGLIAGGHYIYHDILFRRNRIVQCSERDESHSSFLKCVYTGEIIHVPYCQKHSYIFDTFLPISLE